MIDVYLIKWLSGYYWLNRPLLSFAASVHTHVNANQGVRFETVCTEKVLSNFRYSQK